MDSILGNRNSWLHQQQTQWLIFSTDSVTSLWMLLSIALSFWFTWHHKIMLKNHNENKAFYKTSHVSSNKNNANTCKWLCESGLKRTQLLYIVILFMVLGLVIPTDYVLKRKVLITLLFPLNTVLNHLVKAVPVAS